MNFELKKNTHVGGYSLHNDFGYAYCPHTPGDEAPCGTWCALFRALKGKKVMQACSGSTLYLSKEWDDEKTS